MTKPIAVLAMLVLLAIPVVGETALSAGCLPNPLPVAVVPPVFTLDTNDFFAEKAHLDIWRHTCMDGTGSAVLVRLPPTTTAPLFCGGFAAVQAGTSYVAEFLVSPGGSDLCTNVRVPVTTILSTLSGGPAVPFNDTQAFRLA